MIFVQTGNTQNNYTTSLQKLREEMSISIYLYLSILENNILFSM